MENKFALNYLVKHSSDTFNNYDAFENNSNEFDLEFDLLQKIFLNRFPAVKTYNTLFVGTGTGFIEIPLMNFIIQQKIKATFDCLEPDPNAKKEFFQKLKFAQSEPLIRDFYLDFFENVRFDHTYDIIVASHCIYFSESLKEFINKLYTTLNIGGVCVLLVVSKNYPSPWIKVLQALDYDAGVYLGNHFYEDVVNALVQQKLPFYDYKVDCHLDYSILVQKPDSNESKRLLSYLCQQDVDDLTYDAQNQMIDTLINMSEPDEHNRYLHNFTSHILCVEKHAE